MTCLHLIGRAVSLHLATPAGTGPRWFGRIADIGHDALAEVVISASPRQLRHHPDHLTSLVEAMQERTADGIRVDHVGPDVSVYWLPVILPTADGRLQIAPGSLGPPSRYTIDQGVRCTLIMPPLPAAPDGEAWAAKPDPEIAERESTDKRRAIIDFVKNGPRP